MTQDTARLSPDALADRLIAARRDGTRLAPESFGASPASRDEALAVQTRVLSVFGPAGGFKTGRQEGQPPMIAPILASEIQASPAVLAPTASGRLAIELELGFLVTAPLPAADDPELEEKARACVALIPVLEIVDTRLTDHEPAGPLLRLADNQLNGGLVTGTPLADWQDFDFDAIRARLDLGDETVLDGPAEVPGGDAWATFCALVRGIGSHCGGLREGQIVITGSFNGMPFIRPGTAVRAHVEGLGDLSADYPA
ncbi:2-keto-4-pentenoate hydratase (plasmid) [Paroceanicella profunda]|uniref:2-keto-4-pentenoate hydratase n=1 Tax=Paroceanicella profunda TaxID=2579971 RepID=A0A5B8G4P1_9RHOB|nr:fumarylacetoacetate hydrolase family protein [Paroceanicella profunda]QDL94419.1 2-keto-4-pentenoate hydratase [Paroceanicella profunda]